jgi:hypothetical protein
MTTLFAYPWTLQEEGVASACETIRSHGVDELTVASHYHSVRAMQPRFPDSLFHSNAGGCYFAPDESELGSDIDPPVNDVEGMDDPLAEIVDEANANGVDVNAWVVCFHNSKLSAENPDYRVESAFGDPQEHSLCPSHPEVRSYFADVVAAVERRGVSQVQLEAIGYPSVFHGHGETFGHDKRQVLTTRAEEALVSQCFCDACRSAMEARGLDADRLQRLVRDIVTDSFEAPDSSPPRIGSLVQERPVLADLFDVRCEIITDLVQRMASTLSSADLNYYVGSDARSRIVPNDGIPGNGWSSGVRLRDVAPHLDRMHVSCYTSDVDAIEERIHALDRLSDHTIDAGITFDPDVIDNEEDLRTVVSTIQDLIDGDLLVYHHSLLTDAHLEWVGNAIE